MEEESIDLRRRNHHLELWDLCSIDHSKEWDEIRTPGKFTRCPVCHTNSIKNNYCVLCREER